MNLRADKDALRAVLRESRDAIPESERSEMGLEVTAGVLGAVEGRELVFIFLSFGSEVPTDPICDRLVAAGHRLAVPHIGGGELTPVGYVPGEATTPGVWGIREPSALRPVDPGQLDAIVAPGLGFDRRGFRIGYGGGFYDRLLRRCRADALRAGIGFHTQLVSEVPHDEDDEPLDVVVTDLETIPCR